MRQTSPHRAWSAPLLFKETKHHLARCCLVQFCSEYCTYNIGLRLTACLFHYLAYQCLQRVCLACTIVIGCLGVVGYHLLYNPFQRALIVNGWFKSFFLDNSLWHLARSESFFQHLFGLPACNT